MVYLERKNLPEDPVRSGLLRRFFARELCPAKGGTGMKKWICTGIACLLVAVFLGGTVLIGQNTGSFGLQALQEGGREARGGYFTYVYTWDLEESELEGLHIDWVYGPVEIEITEGTVLRLTERASRELDTQSKLSYSSSGDILEVKWGAGLTLLGRLDSMEKHLTVELPRVLAENMTECTCQNVSGNIRAQGLRAEEMRIASTSGDLLLGDLSAETGSFSSASGDISLDGATCTEELLLSDPSGAMEVERITARKLTLKTVTGSARFDGRAAVVQGSSVSGDLSLTLANSPDQVQLENVSGGLELLVPQNAGFTARLTAVSGKTALGFPAQTLPDDTLRVGSGAGAFTLTTGSGAIRLGPSDASGAYTE